MQDFKKIKRLRKKNRLSVLSIIIIMCAIMACISYGYSLWETNLKINGTITAKYESTFIEDEDEDVEFFENNFNESDIALVRQYVEGDTLISQYNVIINTGNPAAKGDATLRNKKY